MNKKNIIRISILFFGLSIGFFLGQFYTKNNTLSQFTCMDITRFHADILLEKYISAFNTDSTNPDKEINQRASDLNAAILRICNTDPRAETCSPELQDSSSKLCK